MPKLLMTKIIMTLTIAITFSCNEKHFSQETVFIDLLKTILVELSKDEMTQDSTFLDKNPKKCICINQTLHSIFHDEWPTIREQWKNTTGVDLNVTDSIKSTIRWYKFISDFDFTSIDSCLVKGIPKCTTINISRAYIDGNRKIGLIRYKVMESQLNGYEGIAIIEKKDEYWKLSRYIDTGVY